MTKFRIYGSLALLVAYSLFMGYMAHYSYNHNPQLIELRKTPISWIDAALGFIMGAVTVMMAMLFTLTWPYRKSSGNGPGGDGGTPKRTIDLPFINKVISIEEFKKMPPKGPVQMAPTGS